MSAAPKSRATWKLAVGEEAPEFELQATGDGLADTGYRVEGKVAQS